MSFFAFKVCNYRNKCIFKSILQNKRITNHKTKWKRHEYFLKPSELLNKEDRNEYIEYYIHSINKELQSIGGRIKNKKEDTDDYKQGSPEGGVGGVHPPWNA